MANYICIKIEGNLIKGRNIDSIKRKGGAIIASAWETGRCVMS